MTTLIWATAPRPSKGRTGCEERLFSIGRQAADGLPRRNPGTAVGFSPVLQNRNR
jgi:hypothetical protein